jgi:hypothetical protein
VNQACQQKLKRLQEIVGLYHRWEGRVEQVKRMHAWLLEAEHILDGSWATPEQPLSNEAVASRFDSWYKSLQELSTQATLSPEEQQCLDHFLKVLGNLRPGLIQCYDVARFPRTNNDTESSIRAIKTRYRRISGRKNWNAYLVRYGSRVAYYEWWTRQVEGKKQLDGKLQQVDRQGFRQLRRAASCCPTEQLKRYRFRHRQAAYLASLEQRWQHAART